MWGVWAALSIDPKLLKGERSVHSGPLAVSVAGEATAVVSMWK